jgi:hypothetical protein
LVYLASIRMVHLQNSTRPRDRHKDEHEEIIPQLDPTQAVWHSLAKSVGDWAVLVSDKGTGKQLKTFAIDPGPHTGICWDSDLGIARTTLDFTVPGLLPSHLALYQWLYSNVSNEDTIVCESFEFRKEERERDYINFDAGEYVGVVKLFAQQQGIYYVTQMAANVIGKSAFWTNDKLMRVGLWKPGGGDEYRHEMDATRHWLYYKSFVQKDDTWIMKLRNGIGG